MNTSTIASSVQRRLAIGLASIAFTSIVPGAGRPASAQAVSQDYQRAPIELTGSWLTEYQVANFTAKVPVLLTFHDDRTVLETDSPTPNPLFTPEVALSNGQGAWIPGRRPREYTFFYRKLIYAEAGSTPSGGTTTLGKLTVSSDEKTFLATIEITFYDAANNVTNRATGTVTGARIVVPSE